MSILKRILCVSSLSIFSTLSLATFAAGYKLEFQSTSILAGSGEAAALEDAGTNWFNSAGLVYLPRQAVFSFIDVYAPTTFKGTQNAASTVAPGLGFDYSATGSASSHPNTVLPAIHYNVPFKDKYSLGLSIVPAWGFKEDYGKDSMVRYELLSIYTKTIDIAPSIAMKVNDHWSVGLGPDIHYFTVQRSSNVRTQPATPADSYQRFTANSWDAGWHAGILYRYNEHTRIGANYRSQIVQTMNGYSDFALNNIASLESDEFKLQVLLPPTTTVSFYHEFNNRVAILGTINYDQWGKVSTYKAKSIVEPPPPGTNINQNLQQNFKDTFDYSLGAHYKFSDKWMFRGSLKYEPTPTNNTDRDIDYPDAEKLGINVGSRYTFNKMVALDFIYGHVFVAKAPIHFTNPLTGTQTNGSNHTTIDLFGAQIVLTI